MDYLLRLDTSITSWLSIIVPHTPFADTIFKFLSLQGAAIAIWAVIIALLVFFEEKKDKKFIIYFAISLSLAYFSSEILKNLILRVRPVNTFPSLLGVCPTTFAFPSGHAAVSFAAATILSVFDRKRLPFYFIFAVLITFSRIYLQCHYFLDTVGGAMLGVGVALTVLKVLRLNHVKRSPKHAHRT